MTQSGRCLSMHEVNRDVSSSVRSGTRGSRRSTTTTRPCRSSWSRQRSGEWSRFSSASLSPSSWFFQGYYPYSLPVVRPAAAPAHQRRDLRLRGQRHLRRRLLLASTSVQGPHVQRSPERDSLLGLAVHHRPGGADAAARHHHQQGIRRAGVADRPAHHRRLGRFRLEHDRHHPAASRAPHVCVDLVLPRDFHHRRVAARRQLARVAGQPAQELLDVRRRAGCAGAVVVRPQRGRVLLDDAVPRRDVLLHPQGRESTGILLPALDRPLLVAHLPLHLGRPAPPALHGAARLGAVARHGVLDRCSSRRRGAAW